MKKQTKKHSKYALFAFGILAMASQLTVCAASDVNELEKEPAKPSMSGQVSLPVTGSIPEPTTRIQVGVHYPNLYYRSQGRISCAAHGNWCSRGGRYVEVPIYQTITASVNSQTNNIT